MAANEPGQPALAGERVHPQPRRAGRRRWRSALIPTTSSSDAGATLAKWADARLRRAPPDLHRRIEGNVEPRRRHRRAAAQRQREQARGGAPTERSRRRRGACSSTTSTASSTATCRLRGEVAARHPRAPSRRRARPRPMEALPAASRPSPRRLARLRRRSSPHATRTSSASTGLAAASADVRCCCSRPTSPITSKTSAATAVGYLERKLDALEAHVSQFESTMKAARRGSADSRSVQRDQRPAGRARRAVRLRRRRGLQADH